MHPELRAYLDGYYARTMARYDAMDKKLALMSTILAGVSTPQSACPMGSAADNGLIDDVSVPTVVHDVFSATTQAQEPPTFAHDAPSVCIKMVPVTCSTECLAQVASIGSGDEAHAAATATHLEPAVDPIHQAIEQLTPGQATASIGTSTPSTAEVVPPAATTTDVDPKAGMQDLGALSVNTFPPAASELDHSVAFFVSSNLTAPAPSKCSAEPPAHESDRVKLLFTTTDAFPRLVSPVSSEAYHDDVIDPINIAAPTSTTCPTGVLDHLCNERMRPAYTEQQQWPPPVPVQIAVNNAAMSHGIAHGCIYGDSRYVWWPPDHQPRVKSELQLQRLTRQGSLILQDNCSKVELRPLPWPLFSSSCRAVQVWSELPKSVPEQDKLQIMSMSVQWHFLSQEKLKRSGRFDSELGPEQVVDVSKTRIQLAELISLECCSFKCGPNCILFVLWRKYKCLLLLVGIQHMILVHLYFLHKMTSTEALEKGDCQHVTSTKACNLLLDKGYLNWHIIHREISSRMLQSLGIQCVKPTNCVPAYLKLDAAYATVVHRCEQRTSQDWGLLLSSNQRPPGVYFGLMVSLCLPAIEHQCLAVSEQVSESTCSFSLEKLQSETHIMNIPVQWGFLNQEKFRVSGRFARECNYEKCDHLWTFPPCLMFQPIYCWELISTDEPFICLPGTQLLPWCSLVQGTMEHTPFQLLLDLSMTELKRICCSGTFTTQACCLTDLAFSTIRLMEYQKVYIYRRIWDPGWRFCCISILGTGDICWDLHQRILTNQKNSAKTIQTELAHGYKYSTTIDMLSCFSSEPIACEAGLSGWNLALLKLLAVHTLQITVQSCDSKSGLLASAVLLFGHTKSMSEDLNFLSPKFTAEFSSYMRTNSEFLHLAGVLWELTQLWTYVDHASTLSSYWWCFSWGTYPDAVVPAACLERSIPQEFQRLHSAMNKHAVQSVQPATSSCEQWDPGGLEFAEPAENEHRLGGKPVVKEEGMSESQNTTKVASPPSHLYMGRT